jgi:mannose-binding lectin 2
VFFFVASLDARSDEFGRNPQHDFGTVAGGRKFSSVLPFWTMMGDAFANEDFVRLTPDRQSKTGAVWNSQRLVWKTWEVMIQFNINGISQVGADGFGFWLARESTVLGKFFGFQEQFTGLGVVIDTYDNDGSGTHPMVTLLRNDGSKRYEHSHAGGHHQASDMEVGHCSYPALRNQKTNTIMKVTYQHQTVTVQLQPEGSSNWVECITAPNVKIESGLYMGLSAATGHLADNHDIHGISIKNLDPDAKYFDSESRFAQFSKYTIAESLGRVEADIRGTMYQERSAAPVAAAPSASYSGDISRELNALKREIATVAASIRDSAPAAQQPPVVNKYQQEYQANQYEDTEVGTAQWIEEKVRGMVTNFQLSMRDLRSASSDAQKETSTVTVVTGKLDKIQAKLDRVINNYLEPKEDQFDAPYRRSRIEEEESSLFSLFNILFFFICLICAYLGFTLYRVQAGGKSGLANRV